MPVRVVFRSQAQADIEAIADTIGAESTRQAAAWATDMRTRCLSLAKFPERSPVYSGEIRQMVVGQYLVFYRIADPDIPNLRRVIVVRVIHGRRNISDVADFED